MKHATWAWRSCRGYTLIAFIFLGWATAPGVSPPLQGEIQQRITGTVTGPDSAPLPDVSIIVKGTDRGVTSGPEGKYAITVQDMDTLTFSFVGFKTVEAPVKEQTTIDIRMEEAATALEEVEVNAGDAPEGEKPLSKKELRRLKRAEKNKIPDNINSWADLGGYIPGVIIERRGANYDVQVRGVNSMSSMEQTGGQNSNRPLYIIDGVPCQNPLDQCGLHPSQVGKMEVLKGADETSFYGSKGGNGVVIITTKNNMSKTN